MTRTVKSIIAGAPDRYVCDVCSRSYGTAGNAEQCREHHAGDGLPPVRDDVTSTQQSWRRYAQQGGWTVPALMSKLG